MAAPEASSAAGAASAAPEEETEAGAASSAAGEDLLMRRRFNMAFATSGNHLPIVLQNLERMIGALGLELFLWDLKPKAKTIKKQNEYTDGKHLSSIMSVKSYDA